MNSLQDNRTKPDRALPRVWRRFYAVRAQESFDFKGRTFVNRGIFGLPIEKLPLDMEHSAWIFPWTRVRTHTLVRDSKHPHPDLSGHEVVAREIDDRLRALDKGQPWPHGMGSSIKTPPGMAPIDDRAYPLPPNNDDNRTGPSS